MADFEAFYLGRFGSLDVQENNLTAERAEMLVNESFGSSAEPFSQSVLTVTPDDNGGYANVLDQSSRTSADFFSADIGLGPTQFRFDSAVSYEATFVMADGSVVTTTVVVFQSTSGHTFMTPSLTEDPDDTIFTQPILSVTIDSVVTATATGLATDRPDIDIPACFTPGTLIDTIRGRVAIEALDEGDLVWTLDHGYQPLRAMAETRVSATGDFAPILFEAGAVGNDEALLVSPQHRMFMTGWQAELYFGEAEVLIPAVGLVNGDTIRRQEGGHVTYIHLLFDRHEIVRAGGALSESYFLSPVKFSDDRSAAEIRRLFPHLAGRLAPAESARPQVRRREAGVLLSA